MLSTSRLGAGGWYTFLCLTDGRTPLTIVQLPSPPCPHDHTFPQQHLQLTALPTASEWLYPYAHWTIPRDMPTAVTDDLLARLCTAPTTWAEPLWHRICPLQHLEALISDINSNCHIVICSDTSMDARKHSCCAWTIHTQTDLWHGEGIVPGAMDNTYSGQSEAFGILMALMFLDHYYKLFPGLVPTDPIPITVYCDSKSVINHIKNHIAASVTFPNQTIANDYDVYNLIARMVTQLKSFLFTFCHVKGHQDTNKR